ncbi:hypothetical protein GCM10025876_18410 [Demequina litorisediminis]|uniref:Flagellar biosynthesis protein FlhA n=1 Tax=Demequina litorisediminis TaxID=1849022 RepID=A0ABQ6ICR6_9MICO|nr:hypothetical protein GCM10025876_18410 [Demequina litorisediminis]
MTKNLTALGVPLGVVGIVLLLVVPLPAAFLDVLIVINIAMSLVVLLTSMYVKRPLDFSVFPSLLLVLTLFRLGLNVASTRLVLRDGYAGQVIGAFGEIVVGGSLVIGLVIFLILVVIQFAVITNGAGRVAEVGARFTLDAMPGKQMAIDADLNAGLIDEDTARQRRADVAAEADFYGAMDGGSKFVKGDAIAGIIITVVNLLGGFAVGMMQMGMTAGEAIEHFSLLTIGDGLVTQIPALLMSVSTGLIVTRATASADMGTAAGAQATQSRTALLIAGGASCALALVPGLPKAPFVLIGAALLIAGQRAPKSDAAEAEATATPGAAAAASGPAPDSPEALLEQMRVHALEIQALARFGRPGGCRYRERPARQGAGPAQEDCPRPWHRGAARAHPGLRGTAAVHLRGQDRGRRGRSRHRPRRPRARAGRQARCAHGRAGERAGVWASWQVDSRAGSSRRRNWRVPRWWTGPPCS